MSTDTASAPRVARHVAAPAARVMSCSPAHLDVVARWSARVGSLAQDLPAPACDNPRAAGYVELTCRVTVTDIATRPQPRWIHPDDVSRALEMVAVLEDNPVAMRAPDHLPVSERFYVTQYAHLLGTSRSDLGFPEETSAVRAGYFRLDRGGRSTDGGFWVHADQLTAAVTRAKEIHQSGGVADRLRLEAQRAAADRRQVTVDRLMVLFPDDIDPALRPALTHLRESLSSLSADNLRDDRHGLADWLADRVAGPIIALVVDDTAVQAAWKRILPKTWRHEAQVAATVLCDRIIRPGGVRGQSEVWPVAQSFRAIATVMQGTGKPLPSLPFPLCLARQSLHARYAPCLTTLGPAVSPIPAGTLRQQVVAAASSVGELLGMCQELDDLVQAEVPGALPSAAAVTDALELLSQTGSEITMSTLAGAIAWAHARST